MSEHMLYSIDPALLEQGDPLTDGRAFRRCLGQYPTGVSIITAQHGDTRVGMAVNSFAAVSLDPALVLWSIRCESGSAAAFMEASHFAVSVLAADQVEVSQLFGASHPERFNRVPWVAGAGGAALIKGAIAHLQCRLVKVYEGGDHWILIGQVEHYARFAGEPLVFAQGQYAVSQNHPQLASTAQQTSLAQQCPDHLLFTSLLTNANLNMSHLFDAHRQALGVTRATSRIISVLAEGALMVDAIEHETLLGQGAAEDALSDLVRQGLVTSNAGEYALTAAGMEKRQGLVERARDFTQEQLSTISEADIAAARRVLTVLSAR